MSKLVVTTSYVLTEEESEKLKASLFETFGQAEVEFHADEAILGGIIVFDGHSVYDGSVKGMLSRAAEALKK